MARDFRAARSAIPANIGRATPAGVTVAALLVAACEGAPVGSRITDAETPEALSSLVCRLTPDALFSGGPGRDGIPALMNPPFVPLSHPDAAYVDEYLRQRGGTDAPDARVVGLFVDEIPIAIPHNILWWHEIVNADLGGRRLAITYCPLTGSALVFDASAVSTARFGVSGLIYQNNLVMFDEETESLWPQLCRSAALGAKSGTQLVQFPAIEMRWEAWKERHPSTVIVSGQTGFARDYTTFPYNGYESNDFLLFPLASRVDERRPLKERVLGIPGDGGLALPFGELAAAGPTAVVRHTVGADELIVLWDREARAAAAFHPVTEDGLAVSLRPESAGFVDLQSGSTWDVEGRAISGPNAGKRLVPYSEAYVAFWFAWSAFNPATRIWISE